MNDREFYEKLNDKIKNLTKEELIEFLNNMIRKIPNSKYKEILSMLDSNNSTNYEDIETVIKNYKEQFKLIDDFEKYFYATGYEDYGEYYNPWGGDWIWEYEDRDDIGDLIDDAYNDAVNLVFDKKYNYAKQLFDLILDTNYQFLDEDGGDNFEISLTELEENDLINININTLCSYAIYTTYQSTKGDVQKIYEYFTTPNFKNFSIEFSFNVGIERLIDLDKFWDNWIRLLVKKDGNINYRLLKEALEYTNFDNYQDYIDLFIEKHPKIYIDIFDYLVKNNQITEIIKIGNNVLSKLDKKLTIRNDIALYLAKYDEQNQEKYIIEAFESKTNVPNLVRIINNGYYQKYQDLIEKKITYDNSKKDSSLELQENKLNKEEYYYLKFFQGKYDEFFKECLKHKEGLGWSNSFIETAVYLWLLVLDTKNQTNLFSEILAEIFTKLNFKDNLLFLDNDYNSIFIKWKKNYLIKDNSKYIEWLKNIIDIRVEKIVNGHHRHSYFKAAKLVVALGEVLESNNLISKKEFITYYAKTYSKFSAFRKELNNYWDKD